MKRLKKKVKARLIQKRKVLIWQALLSLMLTLEMMREELISTI
jgi:hypothetical protein